MTREEQLLDQLKHIAHFSNWANDPEYRVKLTTEALRTVLSWVDESKVEREPVSAA